MILQRVLRLAVVSTDAAEVFDGAGEVLGLHVVDDVPLAEVGEQAAQTAHPLREAANKTNRPGNGHAD